MDTIPSKRRRITGSYSIPAGDPINTNADGYNDESQRRASYKAPTKASIARYNPNLLAERVSISTGDVKMDSATSSLRGPPRGLNPTALRPKMTAPRLSASPTRGTSSSPSRRIRASVSLPARGSTSARESGLNIEVAQADAVERSLIEEEKLVESVHRRGKRSRLGQTELMSSMTRNLPEPELPPTPAQLGLEPRPQSPVGVLSSSPRTKGQARKVIFRSSPLKPKSMPEEIAASSKAREPETSDQYRAGIPQEALKDNAKDQEDILDNDPEVLERRQRLDQLAKQLQMLQSDVGFLHLQIRRYQEKPAQGITQSNLTRLV